MKKEDEKLLKDVSKKIKMVSAESLKDDPIWKNLQKVYKETEELENKKDPVDNSMRLYIDKKISEVINALRQIFAKTDDRPTIFNMYKIAIIHIGALFNWREKLEEKINNFISNKCVAEIVNIDIKGRTAYIYWR